MRVLSATLGTTGAAVAVRFAQGVPTPFIAMLSVADDGKSYVYFTATYSSPLLTVERIR